MQAIKTTYHGATHTKGSRIGARAEAGSVYVSYDHSLNLEENHRAACDAYRKKVGWMDNGLEMIGGVFAGDMYWVFVPKKGASA